MAAGRINLAPDRRGRLIDDLLAARGTQSETQKIVATFRSFCKYILDIDRSPFDIRERIEKKLPKKHFAIINMLSKDCSETDATRLKAILDVIQRIQRAIEVKESRSQVLGQITNKESNSGQGHIRIGLIRAIVQHYINQSFATTQPSSPSKEPQSS